MKGGNPKKDILSAFPRGSCKYNGHASGYASAYLLPRTGHNEVEILSPSVKLIKLFTYVPTNWYTFLSSPAFLWLNRTLKLIALFCNTVEFKESTKMIKYFFDTVISFIRLISWDTSSSFVIWAIVTKHDILVNCNFNNS